MSDGTTITRKFHVVRTEHGRHEMVAGPAPVLDSPQDRVPRVSRLMALAIEFERLVATGVVRDQTALAELGHVTRARVTQIMNLLHLAPDIQEAILYLPRVTEGDDPLAERNLRPVAAEMQWHKQRALWKNLWPNQPER